MYELGIDGEHVEKALEAAINNLGIIQRWDLSYLTPVNEYDGSTRTVNFELVNLKGRDDITITREIKDLNEEIDKQYTVKEEKLELKFQDPVDNNKKLTIMDGKGIIKFIGKARYNDFDENNNPIVVEELIKNYKLDILDNNGDLLFSRNTSNIDMKLSEEGWLEISATKDDISNILDNREILWVDIINNSNKDILSMIDRAKYLVEGEKTYKVKLTKAEIEAIKDGNIDKNDTTLSLNIDGQDINIEEEEFKKIVSDRSDTWYELNSESEDFLNELSETEDNLEKISSTRYRVKLNNLDLLKLLNNNGSSTELKLKITDTKLSELENDSTVEDNFGDQGWYEFNIVLTDDEMNILKNSDVTRTSEKINLEATIVTESFKKSESLKDIKIDLSTPKITEIDFKNKTLEGFLSKIYSLKKEKTFDSYETGYIKSNLGDEYLFTNTGSHGKLNDEVDLILTVEGKNIDEYDVAYGLNIDGWSSPTIEPDNENSENELKKITVTWDNELISNFDDEDVMVENDIENGYGMRASQSLKIMELDDEVIVDPTIEGITKMDNIYYINSDYTINLGAENSDDIAAQIIAAKYDKGASDNKDGAPEYYNLGSDDNIFGGGKIYDGKIMVKVDISGKENEENGTHKNDGEYIAQIYGMSRGGRLIGIEDYSSKDFGTIMKGNVGDDDVSIITVRVDTVKPRLEDVEISKVNEDESYIYFDISFDIEDYNASYKKLGIDFKGGHELDIEGDSEIGDYTIDGKTVTYKNLKISKNNVGVDKILETITIIAQDKAGNDIEKKIEIQLPKDIKVETYEVAMNDWFNSATGKVTQDIKKEDYQFTKGGGGSLISNPAIYATVEGNGAAIKDLKIVKNNGEEEELEVSDGNEKIKISGNFPINSINTVTVIPVTKYGVEGTPKTLKFIPDTGVNTSYLDGGIIGKLGSDGKIVIKLSSITELSGVDGYSYTFSVEGKKSDLVSESHMISKSFTTPTTGSVNKNITIDTSGFIGGSKGTLLFTVYDKLGHKKTFQKTYFIPKESGGVVAKVSDELRERKSKIKIVGDGEVNKFGIESSVDGSGEEALNGGK
jgi:hypothetical protein